MKRWLLAAGLVAGATLRASQEPRRWVALDGRDWTQFAPKEKQAYVSGFLAGAANAAANTPDTVVYGAGWIRYIAPVRCNSPSGTWSTPHNWTSSTGGTITFPFRSISRYPGSISGCVSRSTIRSAGRLNQLASFHRPDASR